jgi:carboxylesterase type B
MKKKNLKPVMLWIHGGAFTSGTGSDPTMDGSNLASRGDVVVVTINYRLGTLGFLALDDGETNGNYGLADQLTALEWVHRNIQDFGGDPDRVTIFGQSAGAASVRALLASRKAQGKFASAIMQSNLGGLAYGTTYSKYYTIEQEMDVVGNAILNETNCTHAVSPVECLRALPASTIANLADSARYLVVDGVYLQSSELDLDNPSSTAKVPLMIGTMRDDGAAMIGYPAAGQTLKSFLNETDLPDTIAPSNLFPVPSTANTTLDIFNTSSRIATDGMFRCIDEATAQAGSKNHIFPDIYYYEFNRSYQMPGWSPNAPVCNAPITAEFPDGDPSQEYFKCHSGELFYVFASFRRQGLPFRDESDLPFAQYVLDSWASFARTARPTPHLAFLKARGYVNTSREVEAAGGWGPFGKNRQMRLLQWPSGMRELGELEQCRALGLSLDSLV